MPPPFQVSDPEPAPMMMGSPQQMQVSDPEPAPMIGAESLTPATPPAPMMGMPAGRETIPFAWQQSQSGALQAPSGDYRTFNEPEPGPGGMKASDLKEAMAIVQSAMRFQGARGLAEDLQRGVPLEQSLLKHGEKLFAGHETMLPGALSKAQSQITPSMSSVMGIPVLHPTTKEPIENLVAIPGKGGGMHIENLAPRGASPENQLAKEARSHEAKLITTELETLIKNMPRETSPLYAKAKAREAALRKDLKDLYGAGAGNTAATKDTHRKQGLQHLKDYPHKADAIKQRFLDTYGEQLE